MPPWTASTPWYRQEPMSALTMPATSHPRSHRLGADVASGRLRTHWSWAGGRHPSWGVNVTTSQASGATSNEAADVLIIGAGASGGVAALRLATAGLSVVCLEQGDWP